MVFDDAIIGSGLSGLGVALGLAGKGRRIVCIAGDPLASLRTYPDSPIPSAFSAPGGLGNYWHGVIPLSPTGRGFERLDHAVFAELLAHFYPSVDQDALGSDSLLVPLRPIRPARHVEKLAAADGLFSIVRDTVVRVEETNGRWRLRYRSGEIVARQVWLAAGAIDTPLLLMASGLATKRERKVSDHIIGYAGLTRSADAQPVMDRPIIRFGGGMIIPCTYSKARDYLYMLRPARFDFAGLDVGIEKRAVFGLPTSKILAGLAGRSSPGLIAEATFNRFGFGRNAPVQSVNFITDAKDIYQLTPAGELSGGHPAQTAAAVTRACESYPLSRLRETKRPDLMIPGIHFHDSLDDGEKRQFSQFSPSSRLKVVDASALSAIGPDHHSFKMLALAYQAARASIS